MCPSSRFLDIKTVAKTARFFCTKRSFKEVKIPVPWGHVVGKWWNPSDKRPVLTLHGWQDNCGSFDRLIPLLSDKIGFLAIDLPGHGYSSRLPPGMYYHNMNYPILIKQISDYFQWPRVSLMGHSLGGISAYVYTMLFPEIVDFLISIDGLKPIFKKNNGPRMAKGLQELVKYDELGRRPDEPPSYPIQELKEKLATLNNNSISIEHCHHILNRNIAPSKTDPSKFYFTRDPRLKSRLILNWAHKDLLEGAYLVTPPLLAIKFTQSGYFEDKKDLYELLDVLKKTSKDCQYHYVEGSHHTHLNRPESVATFINDFMAQYDIESRDTGGIKDDILG